VFFESPELPKTAIQWSSIFGLGIFCSAYGFVVQSIVQQYISPEKVGLIFSLEPVFAAMLSFIFLDEILGVKGYIGAAFIFFSIIFSKLKVKKLISFSSKITSSL
jgi:EamA-like transporter family.